MPIVKRAMTAEDFAKIIEAYKVQNPVKYARKEKALLSKLALLKGKEPKEEKEEKEEKASKKGKK